MATTTAAAVVTMGTPPPGFQINLFNPPWIGYQLVTTAGVCMAMSTVLLGLRLMTRKMLMRSLGWDDLLITLAWVLAMTLGVADIIQTRYGTGNHMWDVTVPKFGTFLVIQIVLGLSYQSSLGLSKASICTFYLRLSPHTPFRIAAYCVMGFVFSYTIAGLTVIIFSCNPIAASWDLALAALPTTKCVNRPADYLAQAAFNIVTDVAIFVLPLKTVWGLQLPFKQRMAVTGVFAAGLFVCIVSMVRLKSVITVLNSTDLSYDTTGILIWSTIEAHVTIVCACVPTLKPLATRYFPRIWGSNKASAPYNTSGNSDVITGRPRKLGSETGAGNAYAMKSYAGYENSKTDTVIVAGKRGGMDQYDLGNESQERIINDSTVGFDGKKDVFVTHTVDVQ